MTTPKTQPHLAVGSLDPLHRLIVTHQDWMVMQIRPSPGRTGGQSILNHLLSVKGSIARLSLLLIETSVNLATDGLESDVGARLKAHGGLGAIVASEDAEAGVTAVEILDRLREYRQCYFNLIELGEFGLEQQGLFREVVANFFDALDRQVFDREKKLQYQSIVRDYIHGPIDPKMNVETTDFGAYFLNGIKLPIVIFDRDHNVVFLNGSARQVFVSFYRRAPRKENIGIWEIPWLQERSRQLTRQDWGEMVDEVGVEIEGVERWFSLKLYRIEGMQTPSPGAIAVCEDISTQKREARHLDRDRQHWQEVQSLTRTGSWSLDLGTGTMIWSEEFCRLLGQNSGEYQPGFERFLNQIHPGDLKFVVETHVQSLNSQQNYRLNYRIVKPDGSVRWVNQESHPVRDGNGNIDHITAVVRPLADPKSAAPSVKLEEFAIASAVSAIVLSDLGGRLLYANESFLRMWGYETIEDVLGRPISTFWGDRNQAIAICRVLHRRQQWMGEMAARRRDGTQFHAQLTANIVADEDGTPMYAMASLIDVTARKQAEIALRESESRLRTLIATSPSGLVVVDRDGRALFLNRAAEDLFGRRAADLQGELVGIPLTTRESTELEIFRPDGKHKVARMRVVEVPWDGETAYLASLTDITDLKQTQDQLTVFSRACDQSPVSIVITDSEGNIEYVNPKFEEVTGYSAAEVLGQNPRLLKSGYTTDKEYQMLWRTISSGQQWSGEFHNQKKNGELFWEHASISPLRNDEGAITHYVAVKEDITKQKQNEEILAHQANYDALTDLPNRVLVLDRLRQAMIQADRDRKHVALMFVDLDHFKKINDTLGHDLGDYLLQETADRLMKCLRKSDTVGRLGGDEFLIILPNLDRPLQAEYVANKVLEVLGKSFDLCGEEAFISASIGIASYPDDGKDTNTLMRNADTAMYAAKQEGRNAFAFFTQTMNDITKNRVSLENHLRHALSRGELSVVYQPFVHLASSRIVGAEALMRWYSPELGQVQPDRFIPIAEDTRLIVELGEWILLTACQEVAAWHRSGSEKLWVAVNLSPRQFRTPALLDTIADAIAKSGIDTDCLELEITERSLVEEVPGVRELIRSLGEMNIRLAIDDFGTGYSSLNYLKRFPFSVLKIDKSFIADLPHDEEAIALVKTMISMGHGLGLSVVAEGIETEEQLHFLRQEGCDYGQGYLFSKPLPGSQFQSYLQSQI
ncbi:EAL domain-containing protein [Lyngbya sp. CCY1209]|uniref:bifunctional diguanylate cyclase/phosphodiesterase n=1 Tax=Lyngbya sp. CCY1209 TaxID=2886103 RepID=UPI002D20B4B3|nr:EAL domain-containing protein [Lyngbya sp. CCY1209]MEB3882234.1 EAL domain-containing protein [Lyngbya sp. CCY1209]